MKDLLDIMFPVPNRRNCDLENLPLAYAYVPIQMYNSTYSATESLNHGTAFPELYKPMGVYGKEFNELTEDDKYE